MVRPQDTDIMNPGISSKIGSQIGIITIGLWLQYRQREGGRNVEHDDARNLRLWLSLTIPCVVANAAPARLYVATDGNDAHPREKSTHRMRRRTTGRLRLSNGRGTDPTLKKSGALPEGGVEVVVRGGVYSLDTPFELTAEDSGSAETPISYSAAKGEEVRLVGGKVVTGFKAVSDPAVLDALGRGGPGQRVAGRPEGARRHGLRLARRRRLEVFFQDKPMTVSRWPNEGFVRIVDRRRTTDTRSTASRAARSASSCTTATGRSAGWRKDAWLHGYWFWDWSDQRQKIESIDTRRSRSSP